MEGIRRIGDHFIDLDNDYESDQLRDDAEEHRAPEPLEPLPPPLPPDASEHETQNA